jgi:hypothetical protein
MLRPLGGEHLGCQHMLELGVADRKGERAEATDRAGMAVGNRMGRARQHYAQFRRHDVRNALLGIAEIEDANAVAAAALAHGAQEGRAVRIGAVVAAGLGCDGMILHGKGEIGPPYRSVRLGELAEGEGTVQIVQHVAIDIDEVAAIGAARHEMGIPDLVEQGLRHGGFRHRGADGLEHLVRVESNAAPDPAGRRCARKRAPRDDGVCDASSVLAGWSGGMFRGRQVSMRSTSIRLATAPEIGILLAKYRSLGNGVDAMEEASCSTEVRSERLR